MTRSYDFIVIGSVARQHAGTWLVQVNACSDLTAMRSPTVLDRTMVTRE